MQKTPGTKQEDVADKKKVLPIAIVSAVAIAAIVTAISFAVLNNRSFSNANEPHSAPIARSNGQLTGSKQTESSPKPVSDVSNVGKQPTSGDAIYSGQIGDQK